jgi:membrane-bound metal-dependent hydrolase YbcI (DUF457 family)
LLLGAFLAISPDLDYVFYVGMDLGEDWHRTFTHSIVVAIAVGVVIGAFLRTNRLKMGVIYALATLSHPVLDALTSTSGGLELFWPFYTGRIHFGLVSYPLITQTSHSWEAVLAEFVATSILEFAFFAPLFLAVLWLRKAARLQILQYKNSKILSTSHKDH